MCGGEGGQWGCYLRIDGSPLSLEGGSLPPDSAGGEKVAVGEGFGGFSSPLLLRLVDCF